MLHVEIHDEMFWADAGGIVHLVGFWTSTRAVTECGREAAKDPRRRPNLKMHSGPATCLACVGERAILMAQVAAGP